MTGSKQDALRVAVSLACFALLMASCGGQRNTSSTGHLPVAQRGELGTEAQSTDSAEGLSQILSDLDGIQLPPGVNKDTFDLLRFELARQLHQCLTAKVAATPPEGAYNRVDDLVYEASAESYILSWAYRNSGDYDQNGKVSVADIAPLAIHFGEAVSTANAWIDGDGSGVIGIGDVTAIAANYSSTCAGYAVLVSPEWPSEDFSDLTYLDYQLPTDNRIRNSFRCEVATSASGYVCVVPFDGDGRRGDTSNAVFLRGEWVHTWGGDNTEHLEAIAIDETGGVCAAGTTLSYGEGDSDVVVLSYTRTGELKWALVWGGSERDNAYGLDIDSSGNVYVTGRTRSFGDEAMFLMKCNTSGEVLWTRLIRAADSNENFGNGVVACDDGELFAVGLTHINGAPGGTALMLSCSAEGDVNWSRTWTTGKWAYPESIAAHNGSLYIAGQFYCDDTQDDVFVVKVNQEGVLSMQVFWSSVADDICRSLAVDETGGFCISADCGTSYENNTHPCIVAFNAEGEMLWERAWYVSPDDDARCLALTVGPDGRIYAGIQWYEYGLHPGYTSDAVLLVLDAAGGSVTQAAWGQGYWEDLWAAGVNGMGQLCLAGSGLNAFADWRPLEGVFESPAGLTGQIEGALEDIQVSLENVVGVECRPVADLDTGGSGLEPDGLAMRLDPSIPR